MQAPPLSKEGLPSIAMKSCRPCQSATTQQLGKVRDFGCSSQGYRIEYDILGRCSSTVEQPNRIWQMWRSIPSAGPTRSWLPNCLVLDLTLPGDRLRELQ